MEKHYFKVEFTTYDLRKAEGQNLFFNNIKFVN